MSHLQEEPGITGSALRRAVIFDWGGVLMRTADHRPRHAWDERLGLRPGTVESAVHGLEEWRQAQLGRITVTAHWQAVGEALGLGREELEALRADFYSGDSLDANLVRLIRKLREQGVRVGLLSNFSADLPDVLAGLGLASLFDAVVVSAAIGAMKPAAAAYHAVLAQLTVRPEAALFVDDTVANVEAAAAVGMRAVQYSPGIDLRGAIEAWLGEVETG